MAFPSSNFEGRLGLSTVNPFGRHQRWEVIGQRSGASRVAHGAFGEREVVDSASSRRRADPSVASRTT